MTTPAVSLISRAVVHEHSRCELRHDRPQLIDLLVLLLDFGFLFPFAETARPHTAAWRSAFSVFLAPTYIRIGTGTGTGTSRGRAGRSVWFQRTAHWLSNTTRSSIVAHWTTTSLLQPSPAAMRTDGHPVCCACFTAVPALSAQCWHRIYAQDHAGRGAAWMAPLMYSLMSQRTLPMLREGGAGVAIGTSERGMGWG